MKFLSDILAKAGLTVDGVVTLNNTATGQTPAANDNSTKLATTAWVRTFVQPYSLPIASASVLGGIKVGSGLSIDSGSGVLSVTGGGAASIKSTQTFIATAGQTVFTVTNGYTAGLIDVFLNGVYLSPNQTTATNGSTVVLGEAALAGDIIDVIVSSAIYEGSATTTDQLPEGVVNLYYTDARSRAAISLTVTGTSGASTYNSSTGVLNVPTYTLAGLGGVTSTRTITINGVTYDLTANRSWSALPTGGVAGQLLAKIDGTDYNAQWINEAPAASYTSQIKHQVKAGQAITKGQAVYVSSADGTNMIVSKASNAAEGTSSKTMGLLESTVSTNGFTNVIAEGLLSGLNTNGANAGDPVWLGTDGNLIYGLLNKPSAPAHLVFIGVVTRANANNGEIFVKVQNGFEMGELHDYVQNGVQDNYVISYESSTSLYKPKSIATLLGYTPANAARSLTINGTTYDLTADRTWTLTTSVIAEGTNLYYTDARVGTYLTNNSYATQTYVNTAVSNLIDAAPGTLDTLNELAAALGDDPNFATTVATSIGTKQAQLNGTGFVKVSGTTVSYDNSTYYLASNPNGYITGISFANVSAKPTTIAGYGITDSLVYTTSTYSNPSWLTALAWSKITGAPAFITSYTETDTLATVTGRGASTSTAVTFSGGASISNLLINGAPSISESSLALGAMGPGEGGQLTLNKATSYTYAAHIDVWNDNLRFLYGTNTATSGVAMAVNMSTRQLILPLYTASNSFTGTAAGVLAFDSSGNIITIAVPGGAVSSVNAGTGVSVNQNTGAITVSIGQSVATSATPTFDQVIATNNGNGTNFKIGDDAWIGDINAANTFRVQGVQDATQGYIVFGNSNATALGRTGTGALTYGGNTVYHAGNLTNLNQLTNGPGYLTGITSSQVTTALGFTPYNATNPSGYITSSALSSYLPLTYASTQTLRYDNSSSEHTTFQNQTSGAFIQIGFQQTDSDGLHHRAYIKAYKSSAGNYSGVIDIIARSVGGGTTVDVLRLEAGQAPKWSGNIMWHAGNLTNLNQLSNGPGYITGYTETDTLASVTSRGASTSNNITLTGNGNTFSGHHYFSPYDVNGNHYPHYNAGSNANGSKLNLRMFDNSGNAIVFHLNGSTKAIEWNGNTVYHSGNLTNLNQLSNGPGYITSSSGITGAAGKLSSRDIRTIAPNSENAAELRFGFTSWANNNSAPYADYLHLRSYSDGSGGSDNLVMFLKSGIGMRIYQQSFGSGTTYSSFVDVYHTGNLTNLNQLTNGPGYITGESDTLASVTGRGASTSTAISINNTLTVTNGRVIARTGGVNTYGVFSGYDNSNHMMTFRASVTGSTDSPTFTAVHQTTFVEYAEAGDSTGWFFKSASTGTYQEIARITRTGINWNGNTVIHAGNIGSYTAGAASSVAWSNVSSKPGDIMYYAGFTLDADTMPSNSTGFTYSVNAPLTGPIVKFSTGGGYDLQINAPYYWGNEMYFRVRNGDLGVWRSWKQVLNAESHSYAANMNQYVRTSDNVAFNALSLPDGGRIIVNGETDTWGIRFRNTVSTSNLGGQLKNIIWTGGGALEGLAISGVGTGGAAFEIQNNGNAWAKNNIHAQNLFATAAAGRIQAGNSSTDGMLYDSSRAAVVARGAYPHIELWSDVSNSNHGGTLRFGGYDNGSSGAYKSWHIGAPGSDLYFLDIGYGGTSNSNPHAGIAGLGASYGYPAAFTMMRFHNNGNVGIGNFGTYGSLGDNTPAYKLDVRGTGRFTGALVGSSPYFTSTNTSGTWGYAGYFIDSSNAANNYVPFHFENQYGNHSWGIVARFHIATAGQDKPAIQFTSAGSNDRWSIGYCTGSDFNFRITQNQGYRTDNSTNDGWGTERFRINTDGNTYCFSNFTASGDVTAYSDIRVKTDIQTVTDPIEKIKSIRGVTFKRNDTEDKNRKHLGVVAQEVMDVLPEVISETDKGLFTVAYGNMAGLFIEAIKEQQAQIESQKTEIEELKDLVKQLINR